MGTLQLSELREEVHEALANRGDLTNARIDRVINISQERIARKYRFDELTSTDEIDISDEETTFPDNVHKLYNISIRDKANTSGYTSQLTWVSKKRLFQHVELKASPNTRRPVWYTRYGQTVRVYAKPDKTYLARYLFAAYPTVLDQDEKKSDFDDLDDAIIFLSVSYIYASKGNQEEAARWFRYFQNSIGDARLDDLESPDANISLETVQGAGQAAPRYYEDPFVKESPSF